MDGTYALHAYSKSELRPDLVFYRHDPAELEEPARRLRRTGRYLGFALWHTAQDAAYMDGRGRTINEPPPGAWMPGTTSRYDLAEIPAMAAAEPLPDWLGWLTHTSSLPCHAGSSSVGRARFWHQLYAVTDCPDMIRRVVVAESNQAPYRCPRLHVDLRAAPNNLLGRLADDPPELYTTDELATMLQTCLVGDWCDLIGRLMAAAGAPAPPGNLRRAVDENMLTGPTLDRLTMLTARCCDFRFVEGRGEVYAGSIERDSRCRDLMDALPVGDGAALVE